MSRTEKDIYVFTLVSVKNVCVAQRTSRRTIHCTYQLI